ncbi:Uncharacterised protein [Bordetella ansorpii]|uniref:Transmembrane protein n=1 Tax=Bordetella ansorpii TaxID=288768 RepID=A0A157LGZ6_9BORD|nr:hypothetical protein [Bordetella ansorpii]SAH95539.1 Uncharacterised protein [Bordetella ansorpii]
MNNALDSLWDLVGEPTHLLALTWMIAACPATALLAPAAWVRGLLLWVLAAPVLAWAAFPSAWFDTHDEAAVMGGLLVAVFIGSYVLPSLLILACRLKRASGVPMT